MADNPGMTMIRAVSILFFTLLAAGCGNFPVQPQDDYRPLPAVSGEQGETRSVIVFTAFQFVGVPYRWGGVSRQGVDCSGLVYLAYQNAGVLVPRTSDEQYHNALPISLADVQPGDLLFFKLNSADVSHVGIYVGNQRFIHAPRTGKQVSYSSMYERFWRDRLVSAGRLM